MSFENTLLAAIETFNTRATVQQQARQLELWLDVLDAKNIDLQIAEMALKKVLTDSEFMPRPAQVVQVIEGTKTEQSEYAWAKVVQAAQHKGSPYYPVQFDDARIHEALHSLGGWPKFYESYWYNHNNNEPWAKKNFLEAYNSSRGLEPKPLAGRGINDADLTPLLIGDKIKAAKILPQVNSEIKQLAKNKELV